MKARPQVRNIVFILSADAGRPWGDFEQSVNVDLELTAHPPEGVLWQSESTGDLGQVTVRTVDMVLLLGPRLSSKVPHAASTAAHHQRRTGVAAASTLEGVTIVQRALDDLLPFSSCNPGVRHTRLDRAVDP